MSTILQVNTVGSNTVKGTIIDYVWRRQLGVSDIIGEHFVIEYKEMHPNIKAHEVFDDITWIENHGISVTLRKIV